MRTTLVPIIVVWATAFLGPGCGGDAVSRDGGATSDLRALADGPRDGDTDDAARPDAAGGTACTDSEACFGATSYCDAMRHVCVGCARDADCRGALKCDTKTGVCRDCVTDAHCSAPSPICDPVSGQCTAHCMNDTGCKGVNSKCDVPRGVCVDCIGPNQPCTFCELKTFSCVGCLKDGDCPMSDPFCGPSLQCTPHCTSDMDCSGMLVCDPSLGFCVECATNKDCAGETCQANHTCG